MRMTVMESKGGQWKRKWSQIRSLLLSWQRTGLEGLKMIEEIENMGEIHAAEGKKSEAVDMGVGEETGMEVEVEVTDATEKMKKEGAEMGEESEMGEQTEADATEVMVMMDEADNMKSKDVAERKEEGDAGVAWEGGRKEEMEEAKVEKVEVADVADKMVMVERSETDDLLCFILDLLKSPEEHQRRLEEIPEIHADPHMDPNYASEEDEGDPVENNMRPGGSSFSREGLEPVSPRKGGFTCNDSWTLMKNYLSMS